MRTIWLLAATAIAACAHTPPPASPPATSPAGPPSARSREVALRDMCPLEVPGAVIRTEPHELGAALVVTTDGDVAEVRRRVRLMADIHNHHRDALAARSPDRLPPAKRLLEDVPNGARIVFLPVEAVDEYRRILAAHVARMSRGACPIAMPADPAGTAPTAAGVATR